MGLTSGLVGENVGENERNARGQVAGTQTIGRAFAVLHLFRDSPSEIGVMQVAEELGLTLSTAHRTVRALVAHGYLTQGGAGERYRLGTEALLLGQAAQRMLGIDAVRPVLQRLASDTGESVNLGLLDGTHAVVVERVESMQPLRFSMPVGTRIELHATSMGKALLAFDPELGGYLSSLGPDLVRLTPKTHPTRQSLLDDLDAIRARGWSTDDEESMTGVRCVAAPVLDRAGRARAAVAVQAPAVRLPAERFATLGQQVTGIAAEIATLLPG